MLKDEMNILLAHVVAEATKKNEQREVFESLYQVLHSLL
jgi:hypothetical protein